MILNHTVALSRIYYFLAVSYTKLTGQPAKMSVMLDKKYPAVVLIIQTVY